MIAKDQRAQIVVFIIFVTMNFLPIDGAQLHSLFIPQNEGETWQGEFTLTSSKPRHSTLIQMRAFSRYNVSISITETVNRYNLTCWYNSPPFHSVNDQWNNTPIKNIFKDGETLSFSLTADVHMECSEVIVRFDSHLNSEGIPAEGLTGTIWIYVETLGLADNSWYRTEICLNQTIPSFTFELYASIWVDAHETPIGRGAKIKLVVNSSHQSTSDLRVYGSGATNMTSMEISPGTLQKQVFELYNDHGDYASDVPITVELQNTSAEGYGNLSVIFLEKGTPVRMGFGYEFILNVCGLIAIITLITKRKRRT